MTYTVAAVLGVVGAVVLDGVLRTRLLRSKDFWTAYGIVLVFQLVVNGVLTGRGVVGYSGRAVLGAGSAVGERPPFLGHGRVAFAPVEDLLFGFSLVLQTLVWWDVWGRRDRG
jgi:lycopene cyclase domain-containing protein